MLLLKLLVAGQFGGSVGRKLKIRKRYSEETDLTVSSCDCLDFLRKLPADSAQLVLTSPPYLIGKEYERAEEFEEYIEFQVTVHAPAS